MKSATPSQAPDTAADTRPLTLTNALMLSALSNSGTDSPQDPLPPLLPTITSADSAEESRADRFRRLHMMLDLVIALADDEDDDCSFMLLNAIVKLSNTTLERRSLQ
jgi:hypothetical protein